MKMRQAQRITPPVVDLTPLIDTVFQVILLLLCCLINMRLVQAVRIERPVVSSGAAPVEGRTLVEVAVDREGRIHMDGREVAMQAIAQRARTGLPPDGCIVCADAGALHGKVAQVVVAVKEAFGDTPVYFEVAAAGKGD